MSSLFDLPPEPAAAVPEWQTNPEHPDYPFGPDTPFEPKDVDPNEIRTKKVDQGFYGEKKVAEPKLTKDSAQYKRSIADLQRRWPGWYTKSEHYAPIYGGGVVKRDFGGFADICGCSSGRFVAAQITTRAGVADHIRKYTDPTKKSGGLGDISIETNVRAFLAAGGLFVILGYHKPGRLWEVEVVVVTQEMLDECKARKEKWAASRARNKK